MAATEIKSGYMLAVEPYEKRLRLIVLHEDTEWVCRKFTLKELNTFLNNDENTLFKGRLQLLKIGNDIAICVKGNAIGTVMPRDILQLSQLVQHTTTNQLLRS